MRNVISYCWFFDPQTSNRPRGHFSRFAPAVLRAARGIYPDFELVIHHDDHLDTEPYGAATRKLAAAGVLRLVDCGRANGISRASLWRLRPGYRDDVDLFLCRDLDSIPSLRERWAVEEWVNSGLAAHAINDVTSHVSPSWPNGALLTGTCGFRGNAFRSIAPRFDEFVEFGHANGMDMNTYGHDEAVLNRLLQPRLQHTLFSHIVGVRPIRPWQVTTTLDHRINDQPSAFTEYVGMVLSAVDAAKQFYSGLPTTAIFDEVGA